MQVVKIVRAFLSNISNRIASFVGKVAFPFGIIFTGVLATRASLLEIVLGVFGVSKETSLVWYGKIAAMISFIVNCVPYVLIAIGIIMLFNTANQAWQKRKNGHSSMKRTNITAQEFHVEIDRLILSMKAVAEQITNNDIEDTDKGK